MIRRLRVHAAKQDWFAVGVDLAIVVVGVFLGIQASNWNQDRAERAEARELRAQIIDNLKANEADFAARSAYYGQVRAHAVAALEALRRPDRELGERFLIDSYQASQVWLRPFQRTAYEELMASGLNRKMGDARTREELASYYVSVSGLDTTGLGVTSYREKLRRSMDLATQLRIRTSCGDILRALPGRAQAPVLPETCDVTMDAPSVREAVARLKRIPELEEELVRLIVDLDQKQALFSRTKRNAEQLRERLEAG